MSAPLHRLSTGQRETLSHIALVACPPDLAPSGLAPAVLDEVELMMATFPSLTRLGLRAALWAFEWLALLWPAARLRRFSRLPPDTRERWFAAWWHSSLGAVRQFAKAVKGLVAMAYFEQPSVRERLGYRPEQWIGEVAQRRMDRYGDEVRAAEEAVTAPDPLPLRSRQVLARSTPATRS